jgi:cellulose synthase/poly-beta-1,6-N-acetylglucosamine synthase-like glycosyltransferase
VLNILAITAAATVCFTWAIYPTAIGVAAWWRRRRTSYQSAPLLLRPVPPVVSVILATRAEAGAIRARVADIVRTAYDAGRMEVIVAMDRAANAPTELDWSDCTVPVSVVSSDAPGGKAAALNAGVRASHGTILVFADVAQRYQSDTIPELVALFDDIAVAAVSGSLEIPIGGGGFLSRRYWVYERWLRKCEADLHSTVGVTGAVSAMRRDLWQPLPAGLILDDVFTPMRLVLAGHRIAFAARARALEQRVIDMRNEYRRKVRTQTGVIQLCAWMPSTLNPRRNPIWFQFVCHKLLRLLTPYCALAITISIVATLVSALTSMTASWWMLLLVVPGALLTIPHLRAAMREALLMQCAVVVASLNGLRGRWEVWQ